MVKYFNYKGKCYEVAIIGYGRYKVTTIFRRRLCSFVTADSELYDYCDDDSNKRLMYMYQRRCLIDIRHSYYFSDMENL